MTVVTFTSGVSWVVPGGVNLLTTLDGYGGGASGASGQQGSGGYGGGFARNNNFTVTPNATVFLRIGGTSGATWFNKVSDAAPGVAANGIYAGGGGGGGVGDIVRIGGAGGPGQPTSIGSSHGGGGGGCAGTISGGGAGGVISPGGSGGGPYAGSGGPGGNQGPGGTGILYGGGGGGGGGFSGAAFGGGTGAQGILVIEYTASGPQGLTVSHLPSAAAILGIGLLATVPPGLFGGGFFAWGSSPWSGTAIAGQVLAPSHWTNESVVHASTVTPGVRTVTPAHWQNVKFLRMPQVGFAQVCDAALWPSQSVIRVPSLVAGSVGITPALKPSENFIPDLGLTIAPDLFESETFYAPTITVGEFVVQPEHYDVERTFYPPLLVLSGNSINAELVGGEQIPQPSVLYEPPPPVYLYPLHKGSKGADYDGSRRPSRLVIGRR